MLKLISVNMGTYSNEPDWVKYGQPLTNEASDEMFGDSIFSWEEIEHRISINLDTIELSSWFREVPDKYKEEVKLAVKEVFKRFNGELLSKPDLLKVRFAQELSQYLEYTMERKW